MSQYGWLWLRFSVRRVVVEPLRRLRRSFYSGDENFVCPPAHPWWSVQPSARAHLNWTRQLLWEPWSNCLNRIGKTSQYNDKSRRHKGIDLRNWPLGLILLFCPALQSTSMESLFEATSCFLWDRLSIPWVGTMLASKTTFKHSTPYCIIHVRLHLAMFKFDRQW